LRQAADILVQHLTLLAGATTTVVEQPQEEEEGIPSRVYDAPIEELELTVRAYNCLKRAGITKVGEILKRMEKGEEEMLAIRNFGKKSLDELVERLDDKGYLDVPGVDLRSYRDGSAGGVQVLEDAEDEEVEDVEEIEEEAGEVE
jgi:DNA-directed RNA polymerase subunit alpha